MLQINVGDSKRRVLGSLEDFISMNRKLIASNSSVSPFPGPVELETNRLKHNWAWVYDGQNQPSAGSVRLEIEIELQHWNLFGSDFWEA